MSVVQRSEDNSAFCILHSLDLLRHNGVCPLTKYSTKNLIVQFIQSCSCVSARLNFDFWMLDATKGKTRVVAVLRVLRHEEGYPLTKSSAKNLIVQFIHSLTCVSARLNFDFWMLDATKGKTRVVAVVDLLRHEGGYPLTMYSAKKQSLTIVVPNNQIQILLFSQKIFQLITRFGNKN